jgi:hypothetical protein
MLPAPLPRGCRPPLSDLLHPDVRHPTKLAHPACLAVLGSCRVVQRGTARRAAGRVARREVRQSQR